MFILSRSSSSRFLIAFLLVAGTFGLAQNSLDAYTSAVRQSRIADRISGMENFLAKYPTSDLRKDALAILVWDSLETGQMQKSRQYADELLKIEPQNALAIAIIAEARAETVGRRDRKSAAQAFDLARQGVQAYPQLRHPDGMSNGEFILMQRQVVAIVDGEAGLGYLEQKNYSAARTYLRASVAIRPEDPRYLYGLALALLDGKYPNQQEGYLYLARAVDLTRGSASGQQIAAFAEHKFEKAGGKPAEWNQYLAAAVVPGSQIQPAQVAPAQQPSQKTEIAKAAPPPTKTTPEAAAPPETLPAPRREYVARTSPVSMGILLQTEHLNKENRRQILDALTDMVRHLRNDDEVFIMAYGKKLDFEQDLTGNPKLLEDAINQIKPESGTALLDAVGFAAGHLERIATNKNRLLLVISDGRNTPSKDNPLSLSQKLNTVRVDCIGLDVDGDSGRRQLESLAAYSGGQVSFANDTTQLRTAAVQMAEAIGIEFPD